MHPAAAELASFFSQCPDESLIALTGVYISFWCCCVAGEMEKHAGTVRMGGQLAYVAQQAWIVNDSLQSNVLFGQELEDQKWEACVHSCSLQQDLEVQHLGGCSVAVGFACLALPCAFMSSRSSPVGTCPCTCRCQGYL